MNIAVTFHHRIMMCKGQIIALIQNIINLFWHCKWISSLIFRWTREKGVVITLISGPGSCDSGNAELSTGTCYAGLYFWYLTCAIDLFFLSAISFRIGSSNTIGSSFPALKQRPEISSPCSPRYRLKKTTTITTTTTTTTTTTKQTEKFYDNTTHHMGCKRRANRDTW